MKKRILLYAIFFLILILDTKTAMEAASEGIRLCMQTVVPSLFPFMVLCSILTGLLASQTTGIFRPICRLFRIPDNCQSILLTGFLGGYPTGAQAVAQAVEDQRISREMGRHLLAFCSNAGPAFLFGMGANLFPSNWMCWALWGIHIVSSLFVAQCFTSTENNSKYSKTLSEVSLTKAMTRAVKVMGMICGWVILFRVLLSFCERWLLWQFPLWLQCLVCGVLELSNGCCALAQVESIQLRFVLFSFLLGFGGICVAMQTYAVTDGMDHSLYLPGKLLQGIFSAMLSSALFSREMAILSLALITFLFLKRKKGIAFGRSLLYNRAKQSGRKVPCSFAKRSSLSVPTAPTPRS